MSSGSKDFKIDLSAAIFSDTKMTEVCFSEGGLEKPNNPQGQLRNNSAGGGGTRWGPCSAQERQIVFCVCPFGLGGGTSILTETPQKVTSASGRRRSCPSRCYFSNDIGATWGRRA